MSEIVPFVFYDTCVRVHTDETGALWFVAKDVCDILELGNHRSSLALLDEDEKGVHSMDTPGGKQELTIISEPGLYSLILRSRKPEAKAFKRWVTHEVIPSIRKTGTYTANSAKLDPEAVLKKYGLSVDDPNINQNVRIELTKMAMRIARMTQEQEQRTFAIFAKLCVITMAQKKREQEADPANLFIKDRLKQDKGKIQAKVLYQSFLDWCQVRDIVPESMKSFCQKLRKNFQIIESNKTYFRCRFLTLSSGENQ